MWIIKSTIIQVVLGNILLLLLLILLPCNDNHYNESARTMAIYWMDQEEKTVVFLGFFVSFQHEISKIQTNNNTTMIIGLTC